MTDDGTVQLTDFANAIYANLPKPHKPRDPRELDGLPEVARADAPFDENHWPAAFPEQTRRGALRRAGDRRRRQGSGRPPGHPAG